MAAQSQRCHQGLAKGGEMGVGQAHWLALRLLKCFLPPDWLYLESKAVDVAAGVACKTRQRERADG